MTWTETNIARALAMQVFERKYLVMVPNCNWTGYECDLLAITQDLRIVDIEVKISRSDLKADAKKDKWWASYTRDDTGRYQALNPRVAREHPLKVWKHYYALPVEIWKPDLRDSLPSKASGVIVLFEQNGNVFGRIERRATPNREAKPIEAADAIDLARLASLRMWNTYKALEDQRTKEAA